ncbi:hypothetical protein WMY93_000677 [Mugilogobius chulae]|uniref:SCP domain-containing protein n=1 Tax=Mugilogobius chulae TaxID=88201 RepID=A0AAW0PZY8_9GOBI
MSLLCFFWILCLFCGVRNNSLPSVQLSVQPVQEDQSDPAFSSSPGAQEDQSDPAFSSSPGAQEDQSDPAFSSSPGAQEDQSDPAFSSSPGAQEDQSDPALAVLLELKRTSLTQPLAVLLELKRTSLTQPLAVLLELKRTQSYPAFSSSPGALEDQSDLASSPSPEAQEDLPDTAHRSSSGAPRSRRRRALTQSDMLAILDYHNQVRAHVYPPAANMELMQWDAGLAQWAEVWAASCQWEHGPAALLTYYGQNLSVRTGGSMVWATTSRVGCALQTCYNMPVWGSVWREAAYLVCNYSPKGNWIGEAPYRMGVPCSMCPNTYRGRCSNNLCVPEPQSNYITW